MTEFDFFTEEMTIDVLQALLRKNGYLSGAVTSVYQDTWATTILSTFYALDVEYSPESTGSLPARLLMKTTKSDWYRAGENEIDFYQAMLGADSQLPLVACFGIGRSAELKKCFLLLDDLSETHFDAMTGAVPSPAQCKQAIGALAKVHACWWQHPRFGEPLLQLPTEQDAQTESHRVAAMFPDFVDALGGRLSQQRSRTFELVFEKIGELSWSRLAVPERLTLVHGDAHLANFLYPRDKQADQCVVVDWQRWGVGLAAADLAYMIALHWYPQDREGLEKPLLEFYLAQMCELGVDYAWEDFWTDYRVCVIRNLLLPILLHARLPEEIWMPHLERGFAAFEDLDCQDLM